MHFLRKGAPLSLPWGGLLSGVTFHPVLRLSYRIVRASLFFPCEILRKPLGGENIALKEAEISSPRSHLDLEANGFLCAARHSCEPSQEGAGGPIPVSPAGSVISAKLLHPSALSRANQMLWEPPWLLHRREAALELEAVLGLSAAGPFFPTVCLRFLQECHSYQHTSKDQTRVTSHPACPGVSWLHH